MDLPSPPRQRRKRRKRKVGASVTAPTFNLCCFNANGVCCRETLLKKFLKDNGISFCGIQESHTYRNHELSCKGWIWDPGIENRPNLTQPYPPGGIGNLSTRSLNTSQICHGKFSVWTRIELKGSHPLFVATCYFPHSSLTKLHAKAWDEIEKGVSEYKGLGHVIVFGDFNARAGCNGDPHTNTAGRLLRARIGSEGMGLHILNDLPECKGLYTREAFLADGSSQKTTIDYIIVSPSLLPLVEKVEIHPDNLSSDHKPLLLRLRGLSPTKSKLQLRREVWKVEAIPQDPDGLASFAKAYCTAFKAWAKETSSMITALDAVDMDTQRLADLVEWSFQTQLDKVSLVHVGRKSVGPSSTPYMTRAMKLLNKQRLSCELILKEVMHNPASTSSDKLRAVKTFRSAKAAVLRASTQKRRELADRTDRQIEEKQADSKLFWARVKNTSGALRDSVAPPQMALRKDGSTETDPTEVLRIWRRFSTEISNSVPEEEGIYNDDYKLEVESRLELLRGLRLHQPELDRRITDAEIFTAIRRLKVGKAGGIDGILTSILKPAAKAVGTDRMEASNGVIEALSLLFNFVFEKEVWPERWGQGIIFPLYKEDSRLDPGNYRPITLLSVVGKLFGSILENRLSTWSEGSNALSDHQGGFRRGRGTPDLIFLLREIILTRKSIGAATYATFIDARKAFDTVWREGNYVRLYDLGVRGKMWRQLQVMNRDRQSKIRLPFGETEWFRISRGTAQGAVESPWLYACFINGLVEDMSRRNLGVRIGGKLVPMLMYADDIVLLAGSQSELQQMNAVASAHAQRNRYRHNGKKSAVMLLCASRAARAAFDAAEWKLSGEPVKVKTKYKYLGIDLLTTVSNWRPYITRVMGKAARISEDLSHICRRDAGLRPRSVATLWKSIVRPVLEYASEIWAGDLPVDLARSAEAIQTSFLKSILGLKGCESIPLDSLRAEMGMEKLSSRWAKLRLGYFYRLHQANPERTLRSVARLRRTQFLRGDRPGTRGWMHGTHALLTRLGLARFWQNPRLCVLQGKDGWKDIAYEAVEYAEDIARTHRFAAMSSQFAARYARIKRWEKTPPEFAVFSGEVGRRGSLVCEQFLDDNADVIGRKLKLMCRTGCLPTLKRVGRKEHWDDCLTQCRMCACGEIESTEHVVTECAAYARYRLALFREVDAALHDERTALGDATCGSMGQTDLLDLLLGRSTGIAAVDCRIDKLVKRYLRKAWRTRKPLTLAINSVLGREDTSWAYKRTRSAYPFSRGNGL